MLAASALSLLAVTATPWAPQDVAGRIRFTDDELPQEEFRFNDALVFRAWTTGRDVHFEVDMAQPVEAGMFTCFQVYLDTDGNENNGLDGAELWVRASIGSRFHPNDFAGGEGDTPAMEIRRTTWADVVQLQAPGGGIERRWRHQHDLLPPPTVRDRTISFSFPVDRIKAKGARYGSVVGIRPVIETSCSDQPLMVSTICNDEGVPIDLDGNPREWSPARLTRDAAGELHRAATFLDIVALRTEHRAERLYACIDLAAPGFADASAEDPGMDRQDAVHLFVQPLFPRYQSPCQVSLEWGKPVQSGTVGVEDLEWRARVGDRTIEFEIERRSGQTLFRVFAWSDLRRFDTIGLGEFHHLDWAKAQ